MPLQQALRHLNAALVNFFAGRAKYPRFHRKHGRQSSTERIGGFRWKDGTLTLAKMDAPLDIRWTRPVGAEPTSVSISKDPAGRYCISLSTEEDVVPLPVVKATVGIDLGLLDAVCMSTGEKAGNERCLRQDVQRLAKAQRRLARKRKGSRHRAKARRKVARIHARMADRRGDCTHKPTTRILREDLVVRAEGLNVKGMQAHPTLGQEHPGRGLGRTVAATRVQGTVVRPHLRPNRPPLPEQRAVPCLWAHRGGVAACSAALAEPRVRRCPGPGRGRRAEHLGRGTRGTGRRAGGVWDVRPTRRRVGGPRRSRKPPERSSGIPRL